MDLLSPFIPVLCHSGRVSLGNIQGRGWNFCLQGLKRSTRSSSPLKHEIKAVGRKTFTLVYFILDDQELKIAGMTSYMLTNKHPFNGHFLR